jgi:hypothetical protein
MFRQPHSSWLYHHSNFWWEEPIMKLLTVQFTPLSHSFLSSTSKYVSNCVKLSNPFLCLNTLNLADLTSKFHTDVAVIFLAECVGMFMIHLHTKFHVVPDSKCPLVISIKPLAEYKFRTAATLFVTLRSKKNRSWTKVAYFSKICYCTKSEDRCNEGR